MNKSDAASIGIRKQTLRLEINDRLREQSKSALDSVTTDICNRLLTLREMNSCRYIGLYLATAFEVELNAVIDFAGKRGIQLFGPRYNPSTRQFEMASLDGLNAGALMPGKFNIPEPPPQAATIDETIRRRHLLWLVPGLAFDLRGYRLGRGNGFYDRLLAGVSGSRVGVARDWQIMPTLPVEHWDVPMNIIVTEKRIIRCQRPSESQDGHQ